MLGTLCTELYLRANMCAWKTGKVAGGGGRLVGGGGKMSGYHSDFRIS